MRNAASRRWPWGAHIAVDPREMDPYAPLPDFDGRKVNLIYENVGQPGMLRRIIEGRAV